MYNLYSFDPDFAAAEARYRRQRNAAAAARRDVMRPVKFGVARWHAPRRRSGGHAA